MSQKRLSIALSFLLLFACSSSIAKTGMGKEGETVYTTDGKAHFFSTDNYVYVDEGNGKYGRYFWEWKSGDFSCNDCTTLNSTMVKKGDVKGLRVAGRSGKLDTRNKMAIKTYKQALKKTPVPKRKLTKPSDKKADVRKRAPVKVKMVRKVVGREVKLSPQRKQALNTAVKTAIPENTKINTVVAAVIRPGKVKPSVVVSHLMNGKSPDDTDSRARPEYNTIPKLSQYSKKRAFEILKSILAKVETKDVTDLVVEVNHGVKFSTYKLDEKTKKPIKSYTRRAITIYSASISFDEIPKYKWNSMGLDAFVKNWKVEHNEIPYLTIGKSGD